MRPGSVQRAPHSRLLERRPSPAGALVLPAADRGLHISRTTIGILVAVLGVAMIVIAAAADAIGLSGSGSEGWGSRQTLTVVAGVAVVAAGALLVLADRGKR